ncbi:hypothetical protein GCM10010358_76770 [Streptomyces minutiscleroticus]|uniref:Uncharacterized protein n=1 Tax=Streptomyces minutiscleroticus TaxID=68238 RepID=A0A918P1Q1_9ACTN|nr:hypothetical protein [Streptomyces minutiscleroticus]GGY13148.1 hypothetical protein GCM10010358_76770 [Streptomyces minutiscleroticus]
METQAGEEARRWLAERGVVEVGHGWVDAAEPGRPCTAEEIAHSWAGEVFTDGCLAAAEQVRLAFGLLDLLDSYWVTCEIRFADRGAQGPLPVDVLWNGYRRRLEAERDVEVLTYSLWADWFEDHDTAATAFAEVLGNDIDHILAKRSHALLRRAGRVLTCSGPVPWSVKQPTYEAAAQLPALHGPLYKGLLAGYHDVHGHLEPTAAFTLLAQLQLPADTPHLAELRSVLAAGRRNHHRSPHARDDAVRAPMD